MSSLKSGEITKTQTYILAVISAAVYIYLSYFTVREQFSILFLSFSLLALLYWLLSKSAAPMVQLMALGMLLRVALFFSVPNLSDDFYRFFWDGLLSSHGINPFASLPSDIINNGEVLIPGLNEDLFSRLNSPEYYTIYPPWCQFVFSVSAFLSRGDLYLGILYMRIFAILAEMGTIVLLVHLLPKFNLSRKNALVYIFNPLVIVELSGNLHYEVFMIFFILLSIYFLKREEVVLSAVFFALAVASKLLPLMLLPFFLRKLGIKMAIKYYLWVGVFTILAFVPLLGNALISGLSSSLSLYFQKFEFNASIYYLVREIGYWIVGWNIIQFAGKWLAIVVFVMVVWLSLFYNVRKNTLVGIFIWPLLIYLGMATIVHPWYVTPLVAFCVFSNYRFPVLWSFLVLLSYEGYSSAGFEENTWFLWIEYLSVYGMVLYELLRERNLYLLNYSKRALFPMDANK